MLEWTSSDQLKKLSAHESKAEALVREGILTSAMEQADVSAFPHFVTQAFACVQGALLDALKCHSPLSFELLLTTLNAQRSKIWAEGE